MSKLNIGIYLALSLFCIEPLLFFGLGWWLKDRIRKGGQRTSGPSTTIFTVEDELND